MRRSMWVFLLLVVGCKGPQTAVQKPSHATGYPQASHLLPLLVLSNPMLSETAQLVGRAGLEEEKSQAAQRLIQLSNVVASDAWRQAQTATILRMHRQRSNTSEDRKAQLIAWQKRHLIKVYNAMGRLGGEQVLAHCREVVEDGEASAERRHAATSVLAKHGKTKRKPVAQSYRMPIAGGVGMAPRRVAPADMPTVQGAAVIDVYQVVQQLRPHFFRCYQYVSKAIGPFTAWIIINAAVRKDGRVMRATSRGDVSSPPQLATCLVGVVKRARFSPLVGGDSSVVSIPLTLSPQLAPSPSGRTPRL